MNFGIVVFEGAEELDFVGPWEILGLWSRYADGPQTCLIVGETDSAVPCAKGLSVNPHVGFDDCPPLDAMLIPGGQGTRSEVRNTAMTEFLARQATTCQHVLSVCTGSFLLHAAGLLSGRRATTHWGSLERLRALGDVHITEQRFVRDEHIWTAAGVSAGIDLMLAFIADQAGEATAGTVQAAAEYFPASRVYGDFPQQEQAPAYLRPESTQA